MRLQRQVSRKRQRVDEHWLRNEWLRIAWSRRLQVRVVGAVCGVSLAAALWYAGLPALRWAKSHPYFALATVELEGNRRLTRRELLEWVGVNEGKSIWDAAPNVVRMRLLGHPWIQRASVQRDFPGRLMIRVQERRPVAIARLDTLQFVDRSGRILGPLRDDDSRDFPVITGLEDASAQHFMTLGMHRALQFLRVCERARCFDAVSEVHVDRQLGVTVFPLRTAVAVVLGWGSWREKLARTSRVFAAWQGQVGRLVAVDVSFRDLVVVKLREEHHPSAVRASKRGMRI